MLDGLLADLRDTWVAGGFVMPPLALAAFLLWWTLGERWVTLRRGSALSVRELVHAAERGQLKPQGLVVTAAVDGVALRRALLGRDLRGPLELLLDHLRAEARKGKVLVRTMVALAPLAGLLGTVTGMIETFDSLASMQLFSRSGGIAGGVAQALVSTQMGLAVAIPGVIAGKLLEMRQHRVEVELDELVERLCAEALGAKEVA
ncbi:MAG: MotA/TolQ/ExbB proton channel family protein [Alphaproteobacteria bacterium]|nr:MotA/TolQ/ExbB proton channel family protein [Alphaproteobacteria bacterium]